MLRRALPSFLLSCTLVSGFVACGIPDGIASRATSSTGEGGQTTVGVGGAGGEGSVASSSVASTTGAGGDLASGAGGTPSFTIDEAVESWHAPTHKTSVYFAPFDDLEAIGLAELGAAQTSLRLAFFNIRLPAVKTLLQQKVKAGVDVEVLLDKKQQDESYNTMYEDLQAVGVPVKLVENTSAADATLHDKFVIVDGKRVLTGSANLSYTALNVSDEAMVVVENADLAARFQAEYDELVAKGKDKSPPYTNEKVRVWMGPEDGLSSRIVAALDAAKSTALVAMFDLNAKPIVDALVAAKQRGVKVVVVLDAKQANDAMGTADETLAAAGVPIVKALNDGGTQAEMHSKYLVVDHQTTLLGSANFTNLGMFYNDENLLWIDDVMVAARVEGNFGDLLETYQAPAPSKLGLTEGQVEVTIKLANVTLEPGLEVQVTSPAGGAFEKPLALVKNELLLKVPAGSRLEYSFRIMHGDTPLAVELGGKKPAHAFSVPYAPGPHLIVDAFVE